MRHARARYERRDNNDRNCWQQWNFSEESLAQFTSLVGNWAGLLSDIFPPGNLPVLRGTLEINKVLRGRSEAQLQTGVGENSEELQL